MRDQLRDFVRGFIVKGLTLSHPVWSWVLVVGCASRSLSYSIRPPDSSLTISAARIEGALPYNVWAMLVALYGLIIAVGLLMRAPSTIWAGHLMGLGITSTLAISLFSAAVFDGAAWSAIWPLVVICLVHVGRINAMGPKVVDATKRQTQRRVKESDRD